MRLHLSVAISISATALFLLASSVRGDDRVPQGVAPGIDKPLRITPRPGNGRNSEGDFILLKDGRLMLVYSKFIGTGDHAAADLAARYSSDAGNTWTHDDLPVVTRQEGEANLMSVSLLRLQDGRIGLFYAQKYASPSDAKYPFLDRLLMRTSDDEGRTWSRSADISPTNQPGYRVLNNDRVIQLKTGRLVDWWFRWLFIICPDRPVGGIRRRFTATCPMIRDTHGGQVRRLSNRNCWLRSQASLN